MQTSMVLTHISDPVQSRSSLGWGCCGSGCCRCCVWLWHCGGGIRGRGGRCGGCGGHLCGWRRHCSCLVLFEGCVPCRNIDMSLWLDVSCVWKHQQQHSTFKATQKLSFSSECLQASSSVELLVSSLCCLCHALLSELLTTACCSINVPPTLFCCSQEHLSN